MFQENSTQSQGYISAKERARHLQSRVDAQRKALAAAEKVAKEHAEREAAIQAQIDTLDAQRREFEEAIKADKNKKDVKLTEAEVKEYHDLKVRALL